MMPHIAFALIILGVLALAGWVVWFTGDLKGLLVLLILVLVEIRMGKEKDNGS